MTCITVIILTYNIHAGDSVLYRGNLYVGKRVSEKKENAQ